MKLRTSTLGTRPPTRHRGRALVRIVWQQPLWALPFAIFFGILFGNNGRSYLRSYQIALVFAYSIGLGLWALETWVMPHLSPARYQGGRTPLWIQAGLYGGTAVASALLAAVIVNASVLPGFLETPRDLLISLMYSLTFTTLFTGIIYARIFYAQAIARAEAVQRMRADLASAELRALRAQVHPHFLFNTLNTIAALVRSDPEAAEDTTTRLADLFRYTLRASEREASSLADELSFVRNYLEIERARFGERLRVVEQVDPALLETTLPSLLLQPLVENAVRHGVAQLADGGTVTITARLDGECMRITIADDGPGIRPGAAPLGEGFGLHSVRERMLTAGPPHAIEIESAPDRGTRIHLTLPIASAPAVHPQPKG
ncbi:MAG: histidine kinase [Candidatus Eisenbacteria bacterium]|uniref:histidine kinase n=1 Tax=Eiseniibacteriota bacterium TaxID=2212470 RepID=A0A849SBP2_UNCEI|nr:histidine kinase [Candidatus Eisenbacteria bacterium]